MEATSIDRRHSPPHGDCPPLLAGEVGKIPTPLFVEGPSRCRSTACGRSKSFSSMADPSRGGARRSKRGESYVAQFRGPCASLGHARPIVEHGVPIVAEKKTTNLVYGPSSKTISLLETRLRGAESRNLIRECLSRIEIPRNL